jgi:hypothetical protein
MERGEIPMSEYIRVSAAFDTAESEWTKERMNDLIWAFSGKFQGDFNETAVDILMKYLVGALGESYVNHRRQQIAEEFKSALKSRSYRLE